MCVYRGLSHGDDSMEGVESNKAWPGASSPSADKPKNEVIAQQVWYICRVISVREGSVCGRLHPEQVRTPSKYNLL